MSSVSRQGPRNWKLGYRWFWEAKGTRTPSLPSMVSAGTLEVNNVVSLEPGKAAMVRLSNTDSAKRKCPCCAVQVNPLWHAVTWIAIQPSATRNSNYDVRNQLIRGLFPEGELNVRDTRKSRVAEAE